MCVDPDRVARGEVVVELKHKYHYHGHMEEEESDTEFKGANYE